MIDITENLKAQYRKLRNIKLRVSSLINRKSNANSYIKFQCNICGKHPISPIEDIKSREIPSCYYCGSTLRFRSIVAALSKQIYGEVIPANKFPPSDMIHGIGMSDTTTYANILEKKLSYVNTFFHKEPYLDITIADEHLLNTADFIISSDVFEHVPPPVNLAFKNLFNILKQDGYIIFSVPLSATGVAKEHFPDLHEYKVTRKNGKKVLINTTKTGEVQKFENLNYHGGCGQTLEMRIFTKQTLQNHLKNAGFRNIWFHDQDIPEYGIIHEPTSSPIVTAQK